MPRLELTADKAEAVIAVMEELLGAAPSSGKWLRDRLRAGDPIEEAHFTCFANADVVVDADLAIPTPRWSATGAESRLLDEARARLAALKEGLAHGEPLPEPPPLGHRHRPSPLAERALA